MISSNPALSAGAILTGGSKLTFSSGSPPTVSGATGDIIIGSNPVATWAAVQTGVPATVNDFAMNPTQMCFAISGL